MYSNRKMLINWKKEYIFYDYVYMKYAFIDLYDLFIYEIKKI